MRVLDGFGQRPQPPLRLPLPRVVAPYCLVGVTRTQVEEDGRALRYGHLRDDGAIGATYGFRERKNRIGPRSKNEARVSSGPYRSVGGKEPHCLPVIATGAYLDVSQQSVLWREGWGKN